MHPGLLVAGGFLLGTVGVKAVRSKQFRNACVRVTACGLEAKDYVEYVLDEAKAECDDILAEAEELKAQEAEEKAAEKAAAELEIEEAVIVAESEDAKKRTVIKPAPKRTRARKGTATTTTRGRKAASTSTGRGRKSTAAQEK